MKEINGMWRGYEHTGIPGLTGNYKCLHCGAITNDPQLHTEFHRDLNECIKLAAMS